MNPDVLWRYAPSLISGFGVTILCWGAGGALGLLIGFAITLMNRLGIPPLRWALRVFIEVFRGTPFLMQLFLTSESEAESSEINELVGRWRWAMRIGSGSTGNGLMSLGLLRLDGLLLENGTAQSS